MLKFTGAVAAPTPVIVPGAQFVDIPLSNMRKVNDTVKLGCKSVSVCALAVSSIVRLWDFHSGSLEIIRGVIYINFLLYNRKYVWLRRKAAKTC